MCAMSFAERRGFPGINTQRADIITSGAAMIETFMEELGLSETRISQHRLREGCLKITFRRANLLASITQMSARKRSII